MTKNLSIMLDSGAFSNWRRGIDLPLSEYIAYCKSHRKNVAAYVNMDCIPGENGLMDHSQASIAKSAAKSYDNLQEMKGAGLSPIPVFHQGETFDWLDRMMRDGESYVGVSPYMRSHQSEIISWMDKVFSRITDSAGRPYIKTHGFGVTACNLCIRYPWFSVDSTSWSVGGGYGSILVPNYVNGKPDYSRPPLTMKLSARKQDQSRGFDGLSEAQQDIVRKAASDCGIAMSELRNTFMGRWRFNINYHLGMAKYCDGRLFENRVNSLTNPVPKTNQEAYDPEPMRMYFATVLHTNHHNEFLNEMNIKNRLLSYAFLRELPDDFLTKYLVTGLPEQKEKRPRKMTTRMLSSEAYRVKRAISIRERIARTE